MDTNKIKEISSVFYDTLFSDATAGQNDLVEFFAKNIKENTISVYPEFRDISLEKLKEEIRTMSFEIFSFNFIYHFGVDLSVPHSFFTKDYLFSKNRNDIWDNMELYNKAVSHAVNVYGATSDSLNTDEYFSIIKLKTELKKPLMNTIGSRLLSHRYYDDFVSAGYDISYTDRYYSFPLKYAGTMRLFGTMSYMPGYHYLSRITLGSNYMDIYKDLDLNNKSNVQSIARAINRIDSKKVWEKGIVSYYLTLALYSNLGFGSGPDYFGPNKEAQAIIKDFTDNIYSLSEDAWVGVNM